MAYIKKIKLPDVAEPYEIYDAGAPRIKEAQDYADQAAAAVKDELLNGAGEAYDTLKELSDLITENKDALEVLKESQSDWNQNNSAALDYIKNRPFYEAANIVATVKEGIVVTVEQDSINGYIGNFDQTFAIDVAKSYIINFDGVQYSAEAGQKTWLGETYSALTFKLDDGNICTIYSGNFIHFSKEIELGEYNLSVHEGSLYVVKQIDPKFIPALDLDYSILEFDITEIVFGSNLATTAVLGQAMLGQMILGKN